MIETIILTGGNNGIGYYMTKQFLEDGKKVAVLDLSLENLHVLKEAYEDNLLYFVCDVTDEKRVKECVKEIYGCFSRINLAIHNACKCTFHSFHEATDCEIKSVFSVNYFGAVYLSRAVLPFMLSSKSGKICFTSSGVGVTGFYDIIPYSSSKGAIEALAKCLNIEYEGEGISFHILHPPLTRTISSALLPIPSEMKADPEKVGRGLARRVLKKKNFVITHSLGQKIQVRGMYLNPIYLGKFMSRMTKRYQNKNTSE